MTLLPLQTSDQSTALAPTWSPNGQCLALWLSDTTVIVRPDGTSIATIPNARLPVWSPDGSRLAFEVIDGGSAVYTYDLAAGETSPKLAEGAEPGWHPDGDRVLFTGYLGQSGNPAILSVSRDGGPPVELAEGSTPAWSPDGTTLAFIKDGNLYVVADGEQLPLTHSAYPCVEEPRWSPDGQHLAFSYSPGVDSDIYVARADGTGEELLAPGFQAKWSPSGQRIAFILGSGSLGFGGSIYTVGPEGQTPARLTYVFYSDAISPCRGASLSYSWSPDGTLMAFDTDALDGQGAGSFVVPADGSSPPVKVGDGFGPSWSPDGKRVAFSGWDADSDCMIFIASSTSSEQHPLTSGLAPAWSPDGAHIAFMRGDGVYVINASGSGERRIFQSQQSSSWASAPAWSPDGQRLAFTTGNLYVADASGGGPLLDLGAGANPVWLPDGERVAMVVHEDNKAYVDIVAADGSGARQRFLEASQIDWSPDGSQIVFTR